MKLSSLIEDLKVAKKAQGDIEVFAEIKKVSNDPPGPSIKLRKILPHLSRKERKIILYVALIGSGVAIGTIWTLLILRIWGLLWL